MASTDKNFHVFWKKYQKINQDKLHFKLIQKTNSENNDFKVLHLWVQIVGKQIDIFIDL